jgi:rhamnogalacturonan endolyase
MSKRFLIGLLLALAPVFYAFSAQTRQMETLDRGLVVFRTSENEAFVSWRLLNTDKGTTFNLYRSVDGQAPLQLNEQPLTVTNFTDRSATASTELTYFVKPVLKKSEGAEEGRFCLKAGPARQYLSIPLHTPDRYSPGDCSVGDLDGDGEYEIVVHMTGVGRDNGQSGLTTPPILQAYKLDGTFLWEINLGYNIREGAHYTQFLVYDFDGNGKAELICKTADGTKDGLGNILGDSKADWREKTKDGNMDPWRGVRTGPADIPMPDFGPQGPTADSLRIAWYRSQWRPQGDSLARVSGSGPNQASIQGLPDKGNGLNLDSIQGSPDNQRASMDSLRQIYRNQRPRMNDGNPLAGRIMSGPEYLTLFEGSTGKALATVDYLPGRGDTSTWGDRNGNRGERYLAGVAFLDGKHPSAVMCRGYYTRATLAAYDWDGSKLSLRWFFDSDDGTPGNRAYRGQGNHSLSVADVDRDGKDEIVYGACVIDHDGKGLYSTGTGHGDALHCGDLDPTRPGLEVFQVHEDISKGGTVAAGHFRDAATGNLIWGLPAKEDVGRGMCADIDPRFPGFECWSVASGGLYSAQGQKISTKHPRSCNFGIWWDGTPDRELLDHNVIYKWDWEKGTDMTLFKADSCMSINGSKATPNLSADLFGDWREEVMLRTLDNKELRIFSTVIPTEIRLTTLMHDPQYRCAISWQNVAYNQPPYPSFYLGTGMKINQK